MKFCVLRFVILFQLVSCCSSSVPVSHPANATSASPPLTARLVVLDTAWCPEGVPDPAPLPPHNLQVTGILGPVRLVSTGLHLLCFFVLPSDVEDAPQT